MTSSNIAGLVPRNHGRIEYHYGTSFAAHLGSKEHKSPRTSSDGPQCFRRSFLTSQPGSSLYFKFFDSQVAGGSIHSDFSVHFV
ncbi:hypothetical protein AcW1_009917 [Taiwanofungus camphoratus]|nr:hypothetical protein AcW1_009917 [Antrodia cinnamomea]